MLADDHRKSCNWQLSEETVKLRTHKMKNQGSVINCNITTGFQAFFSVISQQPIWRSIVMTGFYHFNFSKKGSKPKTS